MNAKSKKTLKGAALAAGLVAVLLLPTGCTFSIPAISGTVGEPAPGSAVVAPLHIVA